MQTQQEVAEVMQLVRDDEVDPFTPIETLANIAGALRGARSPRALGRDRAGTIEAAGLSAELARESDALLGRVTDPGELEQEIANAATRRDAADRENSGATFRPAHGPAAYELASERIEDLLRGYARALRQGAGAPEEQVLTPLKAEAIDLAGGLVVAAARERQ
jgi:hypothetical protein